MIKQIERYLSIYEKRISDCDAEINRIKAITRKARAENDQEELLELSSKMHIELAKLGAYHQARSDFQMFKHYL